MKEKTFIGVTVMFIAVVAGSEISNDTSIVNVEARNITSNSVKFFIAASGPVKSIEVKYSEVLNNTAEYRMEWDYGDNYEVKDLIPSGNYTFQFRAITSENEGWSKNFSVILLPGVPELIFRRIEGSNVNLEWFRKFDDSRRKTINSYEVRYFSVQMERGNSWVPSKCATTIQLPSCTGFSYTIRGLYRNTYYEIQLRAHTVSGYGDPNRQKIYLLSN